MIIRPRTRDDEEALVRLFGELQQHYRVPCPPPEIIRAGLAGSPPGTEILLAEMETIVGFVAFSPTYPGPGLQPGLYVKELFVSEPFRAGGIGRRLMQAVAGFAASHGYARVDWTADRNNHRLLAFYASLGATAQSEKLFFRLSGDMLAALNDEPGQQS